MNDDELKTGDLVFYVNRRGVTEHIALYVNHKNKVPYVIHATTAPHHCVMLTHLKTDEFTNYHIMRPTNSDLAMVATGILLRWVEHQIPFASEKKQDDLINPIDKLGGGDGNSRAIIEKVQEEYGKRNYKATFPQYIEMANALPLIPTREGGQQDGMSCSETIVAAFNIGLLLLHKAYIPMMTGNDSSMNSSFSLDALVHLLDSPLPFEAKATLPAGMLKHCAEHSEQWSDRGLLCIQPNEVSDEEMALNKATWLEFRTALKHDSVDKVQQLLNSPTGLQTRLQPKASSSILQLEPSSSFAHSEASPTSPWRNRLSPNRLSPIGLLTLSNAEELPTQYERSSPIIFLGLYSPRGTEEAVVDDASLLCGLAPVSNPI